ncbi:unnamed protein product [Ceutorhynchus assimilis]|uniref:Beta-galactosidase n=1 Tax=Ceutorhynchus assimilis TaxID=467358 RepID=A0A9N9QN26_9CUCU|nr:unnamed protein product [Ceutorhynchus assimilis]
MEIATHEGAPLPTLYEYYTEGDIKSGLNADQNYFTLNGKNITLYSGAMHYFRTPKQLWRDRLRKMRAAGLNAVETYVPWNLHEPSPGQFDFGNGGSDMEDFLDIETFLKTAQEEDLFAILRPGPYVCAEWEFGGFPSWLLRETGIKFRTSDPKYMNPVKRFFQALFPILAAFQFINGGPIISFQVENEYGSTKTSSFLPDKTYLKQLKQIYLEHNITELLTTADGVTSFRDAGTLTKDFLITANFGGNPMSSFQTLETLQPGRPKMAMEYYPGWFDHWSENHHTTSALLLILNLEAILSYPGSFNLYMFHGGTSFGFMNGANLDNDYLMDNSGYQPDITSYDYAAPLTEAGDYSGKYDLIKVLLAKYASPQTRLPPMPAPTVRLVYPNISILEYIPLKSLIDSQLINLEYERPIAMEMLDINNGSGQSYGYITYRKEHVNLSAGATLTISGRICDSVLVLVNGQLISPPLKSKYDLDNFGFWNINNSQITLTNVTMADATIDLVVENWGRVGYGKLPQYYQFKGLWQGDISLDNNVLLNWKHVPLEFKKTWTLGLQGWEKIENYRGPGIYKGYISIGNPSDTYIDMRPWTKGIVMINGFVLGRYARIGPQQCLYLPAPLIKKGQNEILIFEHYEASDRVEFSNEQIWETL